MAEVEWCSNKCNLALSCRMERKSEANGKKTIWEAVIMENKIILSGQGCDK